MLLYIKSTNKHIKSTIKNTIVKLPLGEKFLLPCLICLSSPYTKYFRRKTELEETKRILSICEKDDIKEVVIVYDLISSPPTYGDFFYTLMLARFFLLFKKRLHFFIVDSDFRVDALKAYTDRERNNFVNELKEMSRLLLANREESEIINCPWDKAQMLLDNLKNHASVYIFFEELVINREALYTFSFNILNNLFKNNLTVEIDKFLITAEELLPYIEIRLPDFKYITWHVRYSEKWGTERNTTPEEFLNIYKMLNNFFPDCKIMIISDAAGCEYFKKLSKEKQIEVVSSKDYSDSFMGDVALILNSEFFFALRGGGIASVPVFSKIPYGFIAKPVYEVPSGKNKFAVWSTEKQLFINSDKGTPEDVFSLMKDNI